MNAVINISSFCCFKLNKLCRVVLLLSLFLLPYTTHAQQDEEKITATATLDSTSILIGQQTRLVLSIEYKVDVNDRIIIHWPEIKDTLRKEIDVVKESKIDTIIPNKNDPYTFKQTKTLYITSFDSGYWAIPPFKFSINNDTTTILTDPLLLSVFTVTVDTTLAIKDIKQPFSANYNWIDWLKDHKLQVTCILLGVLIILLLIYYFIKSRKKIKPVIPEPEIKIPPHVIALEKLERLKQEKLWQEGKIKQYHITLTDIIREYIEARFKIQALEQTTEEILYGFRNVAVDEESKEKLRQLLLLADLVKFAKEHPLPAENEKSFEYAVSFIEATKRDDETTPAQPFKEA